MAHRGSELGDRWKYEHNFWSLLIQADGTSNWRYGFYRFAGGGGGSLPDSYPHRHQAEGRVEHHLGHEH